MTATLYHPGQRPVNVSTEGLYLPDSYTGLVPQSSRAAYLLGCAPQLVDILACGPDFVVYSIFDIEGPINEHAMKALIDLCGCVFSLDDNEALHGPILLIRSGLTDG